MSEEILTPLEGVQTQEGLSLFQIAEILGREKKVLFGVPTILCIITIVISFIMTPMFSAKTVIMPPQQNQGSAGAMLEQLGPLAGMAGAAVGIKSSTDLYEALTKCRSVQTMLAERFKLQERYQTKTLGDTLRILSDRVTVTSDKKAGLITIEAIDPSPTFAADLANAHVDALKELMGKLALSDAHQRRKFFEDQVDKISDKPFRDVRVQELILVSMIRQFETARIDESRDGPLLQQVDVATPPEKRFKPKRAVMVIAAGMIGLILGALIGIIRQMMNQISEDPTKMNQWKQLREAWLGSKRSS